MGSSRRATLRAIFSPIFYFALLERIDRARPEAALPKASSALLAVGYFAMQILQRFPVGEDRGGIPAQTAEDLRDALQRIIDAM